MQITLDVIGRRVCHGRTKRYESEQHYLWVEWSLPGTRNLTDGGGLPFSLCL